MTTPLIVFTVLGAICNLLVAAGLPGGWILLAVAVGMELLDPKWAGEGFTTFGWGWIAAGAVLLLLGELVEFLSGTMGAKAGGGSRRAMVGAMIGGIFGALFLTFLVPIPILGTVVGAFVGTFGGAVLGEITGPEAKHWKESLRPALAATLARAVGIAAKLALTLVLWLGLLAVALTR